MKRNTLKLVLVAAVVYYSLLLSLGGFLPGGFAPPLYFLVGPLLALVLILAVDLSARATVPSETRRVVTPPRRLAREVAQLARQVEVGSRASPGYFGNLLVARVRDALVEKVRLEAGMDRERVREILANPRLGPGLLKSDRLYRLLYSPAPARGAARIRMLEEAVALVEAWKP